MKKPLLQKFGTQKHSLLLLLRISIIFLTLLTLHFGVKGSFAQQESTHQATNGVNAVITTKSTTEVGKNIIFDGTKSQFPEGAGKINYLWDLGDGTRSNEEEVVHVYAKPGRYFVTLQVIVDGVENSTSKEVLAYTKVISVINDTEDRSIQIQSLKKLAEQKGIFLKTFSSFEGVAKRDEILEKIGEEREVFRNSEVLVFWVDDIRLLGLLREFQGVKKDILSLSNKTLVVITTKSLSHVHSVVKGYFSNNYPSQLIVTRPEAIDEVFLNDKKILPGILEERGYDVKLTESKDLQRVSPLHFLQKLINEAQKAGFPDDYVLLFLLLPLVILVVNISKNLFGVSAIKIGIPILITITQYFMGLVYGTGIFFIVFFACYLVKKLLRKYHLLPMAKSAITITIITTVLFLLLLVSAIYGVLDMKQVTIYPILILVLFMYEVVNVERKSLLSNLGVILEITIMSSVAYFLISWSSLQLTLLSYPELAILVLLLNIPVGRYTGLTLKEYIRFKDVIFKK